MIELEPIFDISKLNPSLYSTVPEMSEMKVCYKLYYIQ